MSSTPVQPEGEDLPRDPAEAARTALAAVDHIDALEAPPMPELACRAADATEPAAPGPAQAPSASVPPPDSTTPGAEAAIAGAAVADSGAEAAGAGAAVADDAGGAEAAGGAQLSRSRQKKLAKQAAYQEKKAARKAEERAAKRAKQEVKHGEVRARLAAMSPEEKAAWDAQRMQKREARKQGGQDKKARLQQALQGGQRIILDLAFHDLMTETEVRSLCHQLLHTYAANGRADRPAHIILTSLQGAMGQAVREHASGFSNWVITTHETDYMTAYAESVQDLVYLSGDSEHELESLDASKAYIIGGIVDRNRHKNLCLNKAKEQGIATARLPIGNHLKMLGSSILTVNQVFEVLVKFVELKDWKAALEEVIPLRKRANAPGLAQNGSGVPEEDAHASKKPRLESDNKL